MPFYAGCECLEATAAATAANGPAGSTQMSEFARHPASTMPEVPIENNGSANAPVPRVKPSSRFLPTASREDFTCDDAIRVIIDCDMHVERRFESLFEF